MSRFQAVTEEEIVQWWAPKNCIEPHFSPVEGKMVTVTERRQIPDFSVVYFQGNEYLFLDDAPDDLLLSGRYLSSKLLSDGDLLQVKCVGPTS